MKITVKHHKFEFSCFTIQMYFRTLAHYGVSSE